MGSCEESVGSYTPPLHRPSPVLNDQSTPGPWSGAGRGLCRRRDISDDTCYFCRRKGHWASDCPDKWSKSKPKPNNEYNNYSPTSSQTSDGPDFPEIQCPCGVHRCRVKTSRTVNNPNRKFYSCPDRDCKFFKWCDEVQWNGYGVDRPYPICHCGAGICSILIEKNGKDAGRMYFGCPIKKGQGACSFVQWLDQPSTDCRRATFENHVKHMGTEGFFQHSELRASSPSGSFKVETPVKQASCNHVGVQSQSTFENDEKFVRTGGFSQHSQPGASSSSGSFRVETPVKEASHKYISLQSHSAVTGEEELSQYVDCINLKDSSSSPWPVGLESPNVEASCGNYVVESDSDDTESVESFFISTGTEQDSKELMKDVLSSTARHFANQFLRCIRGLSVQSFLTQKNLIVEAIDRVTSFGVEDCSTFLSQLDDLIQLIDDYGALSASEKAEKKIQQYTLEMSAIDSKDAVRQGGLEAIQSDFRIMNQAEVELTKERDKLLESLHAVNKDLKKVANDRSSLIERQADEEKMAARLKQERAKLLKKIEHAKKVQADILGTLGMGYKTKEELLEQARISLASLQLWD